MATAKVLPLCVNVVIYMAAPKLAKTDYNLSSEKLRRLVTRLKIVCWNEVQDFQRKRINILPKENGKI